MVEFPKTVRVGCFDYDVIFPYKFVEADDRTAQHSYYDLDIRIAGEYKKKRNDDKLIVSFLHELIHAIDYSYSFLMFEEEHVNALANLIFQFLRENLTEDKWEVKKGSSLNILGHKFKIEYGIEFEELDDFVSRVDHDECIIYVSKTAKKKSMIRAFVFMHVISCFDNMVSLGLENNLIDRFAFAFVDTMDRNNLWKLFRKNKRKGK